MSYMSGWGFHLRRLRKDYNKLEAENKALKDIRDELLDFLKRVDLENWLDGASYYNGFAGRWMV